MFDEALRAEIEAHATTTPSRRAATIEALLAVQRRHGWVSDAHLREVARLLDITPDDLEGVATFYSLIFRQPVGERVILVCDSVSCWLGGGDAVAARLKERLGIDYGETTPDGRYTLIPICCLGDCDHAPALMIGESLHHDLGPDDVDELVTSEEGP